MNLFDNNNKNEVVASESGAGTAPLGTIAKSTSPPHQIQRAKRFDLLSKIRDLYISEGRKLDLKIPTKYHRTSLCKHACTGSGGVELNMLVEARKAFYKGLQTCGSVWTCPVCSHKIQEIRRLEIAKALDVLTLSEKEFTDLDGVIHKPSDYQAVMITFTFPHTKNQKLLYLVEAFANALNYFKSGKGYVTFKNKYKYLGQIRAFEVTYGVNGWHPHTHELNFLSSDIDQEEFIKSIKERWVKACLNAGLISETSSKFKAFDAHAVDIKFNCVASDYFAKQDSVKHWGIDKEIVKSSLKTSKGYHPFALADENKREWFEYTEVMTRKRVRQLRWSQGLKEIVGVDELDDEEVASLEGDDNLMVIGMLNKNHWREVLKKELRAKVLDLAEDKKNIEYIRSFIFDSSKMNDPLTVVLENKNKKESKNED